MVLGVSCFDGMASSMRVRNLFEPLIAKNLISASNLIYKKDNKQPIGTAGCINNISYKVINFRLSNIFSVIGFIFGGMSFLKKSKQRGKSNIIYNYSYPDIKNIIFILYAKLIGYKIIMDIVEDNNYQAHVGLLNKFRISTSLFLMRHSRHFTNSYIGISEHLFKKLEVVSKGKAPVYLIPITVNLSYFPKKDCHPDKDNLQIFYGGSYGEKDGLEYLIAAFDEVSKNNTGVKLILTGAGHKLDMDKINQQIDKTTNKNRIIYKGFLSTEDYYKLLNECDIFCMTRINSKFANAGFPFKLGEFLASGKAVIATNVGDVSKYLKDDVNALMIQPNSVRELIEALTKLVENPDKICALGIEARKTAELNFDTEKVCMVLLTIFQSVI